MTLAQDFEAAQERFRGLDKNLFLGSLTWFSTSACQVPHADVKASLAKFNLEHCPKPPADSDKFCDAWEQGERRKFQPNEDGVVERLLVRHVFRAAPTKEIPGRIVRMVVSEFCNPEKLTLRYPTKGGGEAIFHYDTAEVDITAYDEATPNAINLLNELAQEYKLTRGCLNANALRSVITNTLNSCSSVCLRGQSGGLFFVPMAHLDQIDALSGWAKTMREDFNVDLKVTSALLLDEPAQRENLLESVRDEIASTVQSLTEEAQGLQGHDGITMRRFSTLNQKYINLQRKAQEYQSLLNHEELTTSTEMDMLRLHVQGLFTKVGGDV